MPHLAAQGFAFAFPSVPAGDHLRLLALPVADGPSSLVISAMPGAGRGRFRRANGTLYVASNPGQFGFSGIEEYAVGTGVPAPVTRPAGVNVGTCGRPVAVRDRHPAFHALRERLAGLQLLDRRSVRGGRAAASVTVALLLRHVSDSTTAAGEMSAVASADDAFVFSPPDDPTLRRWAADGLALRESLGFPTETIGGAPFHWQGRFVFYRSDGTERYILMQLKTAAGALQYFGFVRF